MMLLVATALSVCQDPDLTITRSQLQILEDGPRIEGHGPSCTTSVECAASGELHLWAVASAPLLLRVRDAEGADLEQLPSRRPPHLALDVEPGQVIQVTIASPRAVSELELVATLVPVDEDHAAFVEQVLRRAGEIDALASEAPEEAARELRSERRSLLRRCPDTPSAAACRALGILGRVAQRLGDPVSARALLDAAYEGLEPLVPAHSFERTELRRRLAEALSRLGRQHEAIEHLEAAIAVYDRILEPDEREGLFARWSLAIVLEETGELGRALDLLQGVVDALEETCDPEDALLLDAQMNLAVTLKANGHLARARDLLEEVVAVLGRTHPPDHPQLLIARFNLAGSLVEAGEYHRARDVLEELVGRFSRVLPPLHPHRQAARAALASTLTELGEHHRAAVILEETVAALEASVPPGNIQLERARGMFGSTLEALMEYEAAATQQELVVRSMELRLPAGDERLLAARSVLASWLEQAGRPEEAFELLTDALETATSSDHDPMDPVVLRARAQYASGLLALRRKEEARAILEELLPSMTRVLEQDSRSLWSARIALARARPPQQVPAALRELKGDMLLFVEAHEGALLFARHNLAVSLMNVGDDAPARQLLERVVEDAARVYSEDNPALARMQSPLAVVLTRLQVFERAAPLHDRIVEVYESSFGPDSALTLGARMNRLGCWQAAGDRVRALDELELVLDVETRILGANDPDVLDRQADLALLRRQLGDLDEALSILDGALDVARAAHPERPELLTNLERERAKTLRDLGRTTEASRLLGEAIPRAESAYGAEHAIPRAMRLSLSRVLEDLGDLRAARKMQEELLRLLLDGGCPPDHPEVLEVKSALAVTMNALGDLAGARNLEEELLRVHARVYPPGHFLTLMVRNNLAVKKMSMGDLLGARAELEEVLELLSNIRPPDDPRVISVLFNLGAVLSASGAHAESRRLGDRVLAQREESLPAGHPARARALAFRASIEMRANDLDSALEYSERALREFQLVGVDEDRQVLVARSNHAAILNRLGRHREARADLEEVNELVMEHHEIDHPFRMWASANLVFSRAAVGDETGTSSLLTQLIDGMELYARRIAVYSAREAREILGHLNQLVDMLCSHAAPRDPVSRRRIFEAIETHRAVAAQVEQFSMGKGAGDPEVVAGREALAEIRGRIARSERDGALVAQLVEERDLLERAVRSRLAGLGVEVRPVRLADVAAGLEPHDAALAFRLHGDMEGTARLLAHTVDARGELNRVDLGPADPIEGLLKAWREELGTAVSVRVQGSAYERAKEVAVGERLRVRLLDPILKSLDPTVRNLRVCPDGFVYLVPLDALPLGQGRVGDRYSISYRVDLLARGTRGRESASESMLLLGEVDYDTELGPGRASGPGGRWTGGEPPDWFLPLDETREEVRDIAGMALASLRGGVTILGGSDATKTAVQEALPGARYVHLATHGWFAAEAASSSDGPGADTWQPLSYEDRVLGFAPKTLCGLALAGVNRGPDGGLTSEGILTAEELCAIDLSRCELAVLSACETNVGVRRAGQGIQSLQAALHAAGAESSLTSLWRVEDAATRRLMVLFYSNLWERELSPRDALWRAKLTLRDEGAPPRGWAGWVITSRG